MESALHLVGLPACRVGVDVELDGPHGAIAQVHQMSRRGDGRIEPLLAEEVFLPGVEIHDHHPGMVHRLDVRRQHGENNGIASGEYPGPAVLPLALGRVGGRDDLGLTRIEGGNAREPSP